MMTTTTWVVWVVKHIVFTWCCRLQSSLHIILFNSLINSKTTLQEGKGIIAIIYFSSSHIFVIDIYESRMSSFISRQAVKTGKSLLLQQQRRRNSNGSTADNGKFHCWKQCLLNYQSFTFSPTGPFTITIPKIGVAVGSAALAFQITVLDPWCDFSNAPIIRLNVLKKYISFSLYRHHDLTKQVNELQVSTFYAPNAYIIFSWSFFVY